MSRVVVGVRGMELKSSKGRAASSAERSRLYVVPASANAFRELCAHAKKGHSEMLDELIRAYVVAHEELGLTVVESGPDGGADPEEGNRG